MEVLQRDLRYITSIADKLKEEMVSTAVVGVQLLVFYSILKFTAE